MAKVPRFIGPMATRAGPGRPGVDRGRPGRFRVPPEDRAGSGPSKSTHVPLFVRSCRVHRVVAFLPVFHRHVVDRLSDVVHDLLARRVRVVCDHRVRRSHRARIS